MTKTTSKQRRGDLTTFIQEDLARFSGGGSSDQSITIEEIETKVRRGYITAEVAYRAAAAQPQIVKEFGSHELMMAYFRACAVGAPIGSRRRGVKP